MTLWKAKANPERTRSRDQNHNLTSHCLYNYIDRDIYAMSYFDCAMLNSFIFVQLILQITKAKILLISICLMVHLYIHNITDFTQRNLYNRINIIYLLKNVNEFIYIYIYILSLILCVRFFF